MIAPTLERMTRRIFEAPILAAALAVSCAIALFLVAAFFVTKAPPAEKIEMAEMTWVEVSKAIAQGYKTVIVPSGGIEENGPHMALGKHDRIVRWTAHEIAKKLGNALVAPVISFVPEGDYSPASGLMQFPGTIGVPEETFAAVLEGVARSLRGSGFKNICFIADHGGSVGPQAEVAMRLSQEWAADDVRVFDVTDYYGSIAVQNEFLRAQGESDAAIGEHAGIVDTSELMAVSPDSVDLSRAAPGSNFAASGALGDPTKASAARGRVFLAMKVERAAAQIRASILQAEKTAAASQGKTAP
jgi:creatinine amidohydrolase